MEGIKIVKKELISDDCLKGPPVVSQPSKTEPGKVLVDWKESIKNPR